MDHGTVDRMLLEASNRTGGNFFLRNNQPPIISRISANGKKTDAKQTLRRGMPGSLGMRGYCPIYQAGQAGCRGLARLIGNARAELLQYNMNDSFMKKLDFPAEYSILIIIGEWLRWSSFPVNAAPFFCFASKKAYFRNPQALWHKRRGMRKIG